MAGQRSNGGSIFDVIDSAIRRLNPRILEVCMAHDDSFVPRADGLSSANLSKLLIERRGKKPTRVPSPLTTKIPSQSNTTDSEKHK
jgi:hypothetical protein